MLTIENIARISGYQLNIKGEAYYFKGWDNTTNEVAIFHLLGLNSSKLKISFVLDKKGKRVFDGNTNLIVYGIKYNGLGIFHTKDKLDTPAEFRNTIEEFLNSI